MEEDRTRKSLVEPLSLMASPGVYTVTLKAGEAEQTQQFELIKDPNTTGSLADIERQKALLDRIRTDFEAISLAINEAERIRRQLLDLKPLVTEDLEEDVEALYDAVTGVENRMLQLKHSGKGQDVIRLPGMLMEKLAYLASTVAIADFKPADQYRAVYEKLHGEWLAVKASWEQLKDSDVAAFRAMMNENQIGPLIVEVQ